MDEREASSPGQRSFRPGQSREDDLMQGHVGALLTSRLDERRHGQGQDQTGNQGRDSEQPRGGAHDEAAIR